jgi:teichuronic acid biosynthesis glycosyltransferase TuaC
MRVLVLTTIYPNRRRPTYGVFVHERIRHVAARCEVIVVAPIPWFPFNRWLRGREFTGVPLKEPLDGITIYHPRFLSVPRIAKSLDGILYALSLLPFLVWLRRRFSFDLIDAQFGYPDGVGAALLAGIFRRPLCVTLRGDESRVARFALRRRQLRAALQRATVVAVSDALSQLARDLDVPEERICVIPNGVDVTRFQPSDQLEARMRLGLPMDRAILVAVGSLIGRKGHHLIVPLLPALLERRPNLLYVAVGNLGGRQSCAGLIELLVREHELESHVKVVIARPHEEMPLWLAAADLFCLATSHEGCSNAILEALACGLPVVSTTVGGNPEIVRAEDGILVPFWNPQAFVDALVRALDHPWDRAAIAQRMSSHGWDRTAASMIENYGRVLETSRPSATGCREA